MRVYGIKVWIVDTRASQSWHHVCYSERLGRFLRGGADNLIFFWADRKERDNLLRKFRLLVKKGHYKTSVFSGITDVRPCFYEVKVGK